MAGTWEPGRLQEPRKGVSSSLGVVRESFRQEGASALRLGEHGSREPRGNLVPGLRTNSALCWKYPVVQRPVYCRGLAKLALNQIR